MTKKFLFIFITVCSFLNSMEQEQLCNFEQSTNKIDFNLTQIGLVKVIDKAHDVLKIKISNEQYEFIKMISDFSLKIIGEDQKDNNFLIKAIANINNTVLIRIDRENNEVAKNSWLSLYADSRDLETRNIQITFGLPENNQIALEQQSMEIDSQELPETVSIANNIEKEKTQANVVCHHDSQELAEAMPNDDNIEREKTQTNVVCNYEGCGKSFYDSSNLRRHQRIHTLEKPYKCNYKGCRMSFSDSSNLKNHKKTHTGKRLHDCDYEGCEKSFFTSTDLARHKRMHTDEKPYVCDYEGCAKSFTDSGNLKKHERTHTGEKPYVCDYLDCDKSYSSSSNLNRHKKIHDIKRKTKRKHIDDDQASVKLKNTRPSKVRKVRTRR